MKNTKPLRIMASLVASNIGIALLSYAGFRMGLWSNQTLWRIMFADGIWFCVGSAFNMINMAWVASGA